MVETPETPPQTILFGVNNVLTAKAVIAVPSIMYMNDFNLFIISPLLTALST